MTEPRQTVLAWRLSVLMAEREIRTTRALRARLAAVGVEISEAQLGRIVKKLPKLISTELLAGLCSVLQVAPGELIIIPGFRTPPMARHGKIEAPSHENSAPEEPAVAPPRVLPRSSTGRPQATVIPRPKY